MFGFIKKKIGEASDAAVITEAQSFRQLLSVASEDEASTMLVATALAAKHLKNSTLVQRRFPEAYLHGIELANTPEAQGQLSLCVLEIIQLHNASKATDRPMSQLAAAGYSVLIHSIRAVGRNPQMLVEGRLLWKELIRGLPQYLPTYHEFINPNASEEQMVADLFVPRMLVPDFR